jgi:hypothetical protein
MLEIDKSKWGKRYVAFVIYALYFYNLFFKEIPITKIVPIQLILSLILTAVGFYALFKDNIILTSSNKIDKIFVIAAVTQYAPVWELLKLIPGSMDFIEGIFIAYYYSSVILHSCLNDNYPQFFDKFKKFNFGFSIQYLILVTLNVQVNKIIPCAILGVVFIYFSAFNFDHMTVIASNVVYSVILIEAWIPLAIILSPSKDRAAALFGFFIAGITTVLICLIVVTLQLIKVNRGAYDDYDKVKNGGDVEEGIFITTQANNTGSNNYSTFTN